MPFLVWGGRIISFFIPTAIMDKITGNSQQQESDKKRQTINAFLLIGIVILSYLIFFRK